MSASERVSVSKGQAPWSFGATLEQFDLLKDEEGRPLLENRSPAQAKEGVPMRTRRCPYADERLGKLMNVSALEQVTAHLDDTLDDVLCFHASLTTERPSWGRFCTALLDQVAQPALFVHLSPERSPRLPVRMAVGYKIAAGYLVPIRELMTLELQGRAPAATVENLLRHVHDRASLVGAREVCSAPMSMVRRVSDAFMNGSALPRPRVSPERVATAKTLALQVWLQLAWRQVEQRTEHRLLIEECPPGALKARTPHVATRLAERPRELSPPGQIDWEILRKTLGTQRGAPLEQLVVKLKDDVDAWPSLSDIAAELMAKGEGALFAVDPKLIPHLARRFATYYATYQAFARTFSALERELWAALSLPPDGTIALSGGFSPTPLSLKWFEMLLGHKVVLGDDGSAVLRNQHGQRRVPPREEPRHS